MKEHTFHMKGPQNNNIITHLKANTKRSLINTLVYISEKDQLLEYQQSLPFIDIFSELYEQWKGSYLIDQKWFHEIFSLEIIISLKYFDSAFESFFKSNDSSRKISETIESQSWIHLSKEAKSLLNKI